MWLFCDRGFFSVVAKEGPGVIHEDQLTVRTRVRSDMVALCRDLEIDPDEIQSTPQADYPWRLVLHRDDFALWVGQRIGSLDYPNFKGRILQLFGLPRESLFSRVWSLMMSLKEGM